MRNSIWAAVAYLAIAGCSSNPSPSDSGMKDLAGSSSTDLPAVPKIGCIGYVQCLLDCGKDTVCSAQCEQSVTPVGKKKFLQAISCGQNWCLGSNDMGSGDCIVTGMNLTNKDGSAANTGTVCGDCLNNSLAALFGDACSPPSSPNCNPPLCKAQNDACFASMP